jgi:hypothetical protein
MLKLSNGNKKEVAIEGRHFKMSINELKELAYLALKAMAFFNMTIH